MTAEPTRERVKAYEAALGCQLYDAQCMRHQYGWADLGCPVAVTAARVEAERVAEVERQRDAAQARTVKAKEDQRQAWSVAAQRRDEARAEHLRANAAEVEVDALRAVVEQVRALHVRQTPDADNFDTYHPKDDVDYCIECLDPWPCPTVALLPEPERPSR